jgi:hypothetical protein
VDSDLLLILVQQLKAFKYPSVAIIAVEMLMAYCECICGTVDKIFYIYSLGVSSQNVN